MSGSFSKLRATNEPPNPYGGLALAQTFAMIFHRTDFFDQALLGLAAEQRYACCHHPEKPNRDDDEAIGSQSIGVHGHGR